MDSQQVRIERLVAGGDALGRLSDGRVVFVPGALPDEVVDIQITHTKADFARAKLLQIVTESPHRIAPPCEHVERGCGGCSWQHLASTAQVTAKVEIVREALRRNGKITDIDAAAIRVSGLPSLPAGMVTEGMDIIIRVRPVEASQQ